MNVRGVTVDEWEAGVKRRAVGPGSGSLAMSGPGSGLGR